MQNEQKDFKCFLYNDQQKSAETGIEPMASGFAVT